MGIEFSPEQLEGCQGCDLSRCLGCSQREIESSDMGDLLGAIGVRYSKFAWKNQRKFKNYLGDDVDPVKHGAYQAKHVAIPLIEAQNNSDKRHFTFDEAKDLVLANVYHDVHEGLTGDIPQPEKTRESDIAEMAINKKVLEELGVHSVLAYKMHQILSDHEGETFTGRAHQLVENLGYLATGLRAWQIRDFPVLNGEERKSCREMGLQVAPSAANRVLGFTDEFAYAGQFLEENNSRLRSMGWRNPSHS